jgi:hypothetical protein
MALRRDAMPSDGDLDGQFVEVVGVITVEPIDDILVFRGPIRPGLRGAHRSPGSGRSLLTEQVVRHLKRIDDDGVG